MERELRVTPLFRAVDRRKGSVTLSDRRWSRHRAREAIERRAIRAGDEGVISSGYIGCHSLYDRREEQVSLDEVERIGI